MELETDTQQEATQLLNQIQQCCREYPTQPSRERGLTFATMRTAAESVIVLAEDYASRDTALRVRGHANTITATIDDLADRFGSDEPGHCRICSKKLTTVALSQGNEMSYCTNCPTPILEAVRAISDELGTDTL